MKTFEQLAGGDGPQSCRASAEVFPCSECAVTAAVPPPCKPESPYCKKKRRPQPPCKFPNLPLNKETDCLEEPVRVIVRIGQLSPTRGGPVVGVPGKCRKIFGRSDFGFGKSRQTN